MPALIPGITISFFMRSIVFIIGITFVFALCIIAAKRAADEAVAGTSSAVGRRVAHISFAAVGPP